MNKYSVFAISVAILLVLCLPVSVLAAGELTPLRATLYGAIVGNTSSATFSLPVYQVDSDTFCVVPSNNYNAVSQMNFFFSIPSGFTSFKIVFSFDEGYFSNIADGSFTLSMLAYNYSGGGFSSSQSLTGYSSSQTTSNGRVTITHQWRGSAIDRNCVSVGFKLNATVANKSQYYNFDVDEFVVNGVAIEDLAVTETNAGFAEDISALSQNENEWWQRVVMPDYDQFLDDPNIIDGSTDYRLAIREISFNNFLVPGMITLVFIMAFYGFLLYGKKG